MFGIVISVRLHKIVYKKIPYWVFWEMQKSAWNSRRILLSQEVTWQFDLALVKLSRSSTFYYSFSHLSPIIFYRSSYYTHHTAFLYASNIEDRHYIYVYIYIHCLLCMCVKDFGSLRISKPLTLSIIYRFSSSSLPSLLRFFSRLVSLFLAYSLSCWALLSSGTRQGQVCRCRCAGGARRLPEIPDILGKSSRESHVSPYHSVSLRTDLIYYNGVKVQATNQQRPVSRPKSFQLFCFLFSAPLTYFLMIFRL